MMYSIYMNKKGLFVLLLLSVILISLTSFVYAQPLGVSSFDFRNAGNQIIDWTKNIFGPFFEVIIGTDTYDNFFWAKILLLILLYALITFILSRVETFSDKPGVIFIISAVISIFAVRYIQENDLIKGILIPYGATGIAIFVALPIIIYFLFVNSTIQGGVGRRIAWMFFLVIFLVLWLRRYSEIPADLNWIYWIGLIAVGINVLFDSQIHHYFALSRLQRWSGNRRIVELARLEHQLEQVVNEDTPHAKQATRILRRKIANLERER